MNVTQFFISNFFFYKSAHIKIISTYLAHKTCLDIFQKWITPLSFSTFTTRWQHMITSDEISGVSVWITGEVMKMCACGRPAAASQVRWALNHLCSSVGTVWCTMLNPAAAQPMDRKHYDTDFSNHPSIYPDPDRSWYNWVIIYCGGMGH